MGKRLSVPLDLPVPEEEPFKRSHHTDTLRGRQRPFVAWDGEGISYTPGEAQSYVLFGASTGDYIKAPDGKTLGTVDCFDLLLNVERQNPDCIHVGFGMTYDYNMILRDLDRRHLWRLYRHNVVRWQGYRIELRPHKWLALRKAKTALRLFDVWGFFQSSFVVACERFLGADDPELDAIRAGKMARSEFTFDQLNREIVPYWQGELRLLLRLMNSLRNDLATAGFSLASWHGPGAIANAVLRQHKIGAFKNDCPRDIQRAAQFGYAGGRFELFRCGLYRGSVYEYDINSAYPTAIAGLPNLAGADWEYVDRYEPGSFGIWHIRHVVRGVTFSGFSTPQPFFHRDKSGHVCYPTNTEGWYWTPEAAFANPLEIKGGWVLRHDGSKPFDFVPEMYERRREWKQQGISAEKALKLALNSLYGKMAQRTGWNKYGDPIPRWHQLEWAGFVTSTTRAALWAAISQKPESVIAVETDAVFTTEPLNLPIGGGLGQWELSEFDWICYIQSGLYYAGKEGKTVAKYRGFDKGSLPYNRVERYLGNLDQGRTNARLFGATTRHIGMGMALRTKAVWNSWETNRRRVEIGGGGKRSHVPRLCQACREGRGFLDGLHPLAVTAHGGKSHPHAIPWLDDSVETWYDDPWNDDEAFPS